MCVCVCLMCVCVCVCVCECVCRGCDVAAMCGHGHPLQARLRLVSAVCLSVWQAGRQAGRQGSEEGRGLGWLAGWQGGVYRLLARGYPHTACRFCAAVTVQATSSHCQCSRLVVLSAVRGRSFSLSLSLFSKTRQQHSQTHRL